MENQITQNPIQEPVPTAPIGPPPPPKKNSGIVLGILLLILGIVVGLMIDKTTLLSNIRIPYLGIKPTPTPTAPTPTPDPTAAWQTYTDSTLGFEFKYPNEYTSSNEKVNGIADDSRIDFETDAATYLTLIRKNPIPYDEKNFCSPSTKVYPCIYTEGWGQGVPVSEMLLGGKKAVSFYMTASAGPDSAYHVIVTKEAPYIELRMFVAGGGLDNTFDQILSTFTFLDQNNKKDQTGGQRVNCPTARPQVCTMECTLPPPYICGSDGKSYCTVCQACSNPEVSWYVMQATPCAEGETLINSNPPPTGCNAPTGMSCL